MTASRNETMAALRRQWAEDDATRLYSNQLNKTAEVV